MKKSTLQILLASLFLCGFLKAQGNQDYFAVHAGELPVKVYYGLKAQPMSLIGLDPAKGIIFAKVIDRVCWLQLANKENEY